MKKTMTFINLLNDVIEEAINEETRVKNGTSRWEEKELKHIVVPEMNELKLYADKGEILFKYGKRQRMLESTYLITDSLNALDNTPLGKRIMILQDVYNTFP